MSGIIFKNSTVYPIKIGNLANSIIYAEFIADAESRNALFNRPGPDHCSNHSGRVGVSISPPGIPRV